MTSDVHNGMMKNVLFQLGYAPKRQTEEFKNS